MTNDIFAELKINAKLMMAKKSTLMEKGLKPFSAEKCIEMTLLLDYIIARTNYNDILKKKKELIEDSNNPNLNKRS